MRRLSGSGVATWLCSDEPQVHQNPLAADFDERDPAVQFLIARAIAACRAQGKYIGICGQGPSDHPDFAQWLAKEGIASISLNPDTVIDTWQKLAGC